MKLKNNKIMPLFMSGLFICLLLTCSKKENSNIQITEENGITIVNNPAKPLYPKAKFIYEEELSIGQEEGDSNYVFFRPGGISVDAEENIYVLDSGNHRVQCFDSEGNFRDSFGKKGQGPGEFLMPYILELWGDQIFYVMDLQNRAILVFKKDGEFVRNITIKEGSPQFIHVDEKQNLFMGKLDRGKDPNDQLLRVDRYNSNGEWQNNLVTFKLTNFKFIRTEKSATIIPLMFAPRGVWTADRSGRVYSGLGDSYDIAVQNADSTLVKKIRRKWQAVPVLEEDKAKVKAQFENMPPGMVKKVEFCENKPAFSSFVIDDLNNLWVGLSKEFGVKENRYDIFDPEGRYLYQVEISVSPNLFKNGKIYTIESTEDGVVKVKRYNYHWEK